MRRALLTVAAVLGSVTLAGASLGTAGFRAVGVALATNPIAALAVAPDGRLFAAVQGLAQTIGSTPGTTTIRVYSTYATNDGSVLERGTVWATLDDIRSTGAEEGLLGIALAPDFATSKLLYAYVTTTGEELNQHVRVYRENSEGLGEYLGTVLTTLEPPVESSTRNGGALGFGPDGCLWLGVGDNNSRWHAQLKVGTDSIGSTEAAALCTDVCLGTAEYPDRTITHDGGTNRAGKLLRMAVDGGSEADVTVAAGGLRNPTSLMTHPLTGQMLLSERGDTQRAEIDVIGTDTNYGWPCLEGNLTASGSLAACLVGHTPEEVLANHPSWQQPLLTHEGSPLPIPTGLSAYTGLAYPAEFYGDVFYLLRDSARIYRMDLEPPCFLPDPAGTTPLVFHDQANDGDFAVTYDRDDDGDLDTVALTALVALAQAKDPLGRDVLYVAGKQGSSSTLTDDSVIFRIEFATTFTPYAGPTGRVPASCYAGAGIDDPFDQPRCLPPGSGCTGQPDGASCSDGNPCNGDETCEGAICRVGTPLADGATCGTALPCHEAPLCQAAACQVPALQPDGTPCSDGDPCNGSEACTTGACGTSAGPGALTVRSFGVKATSVSFSGEITLAAPVTPETTDDVTFELRDDGGTIAASLLEHPASDPGWRPPRGPSTHYYRDPQGTQGGLVLVSMRPRRGGATGVKVKARGVDLAGLDQPNVTSRFRVGPQCFVTSAVCVKGKRSTKCH